MVVCTVTFISHHNPGRRVRGKRRRRRGRERRMKEEKREGRGKGEEIWY